MRKVYLILMLLLAACTVKQELITDNPATMGEAVAGTENANACEECIASEFGVKQDPDTAFNFTNGKRLLICGYYEPENGRKIFSEFVLSECGDRDIIDFWDATEQYEVEYSQDTLKLHKLQLLALGSNRELVNKPWLTEYFYYKGNKLKRDVRFNASIKYNQGQILETLREFENTQWMAPHTASEAYVEEKMVLANRLMISAVSGSDKADTYLKEFDSKLKTDGAYAERYNELLELRKAAKRLQ